MVQLQIIYIDRKIFFQNLENGLRPIFRKPFSQNTRLTPPSSSLLHNTPPPLVSLTWQPHSPLSLSHGNPPGLRLSRTNPPSHLFRTNLLSRFGRSAWYKSRRTDPGPTWARDGYDWRGLAIVVVGFANRICSLSLSLSLSLSRFVG